MGSGPGPAVRGVGGAAGFRARVVGAGPRAGSPRPWSGSGCFRQVVRTLVMAVFPAAVSHGWYRVFTVTWRAT